MANPVPNSGRAIPMRNPRTGAPWSVSYDHVRKTYFHEPQGNLRFIRQPFYSRELAPYLVPAPGPLNGMAKKARQNYGQWFVTGLRPMAFMKTASAQKGTGRRKR